LRLPTDFKKRIKETFYDKEFVTFSVVESVDAEGMAKLLKDEETTCYGNVSFSNLAKIQEDFGLGDNVDIVITTDEVIERGTILNYLDLDYIVLESIPYDSHNLIMGKITVVGTVPDISA